MGKQDDAAAEAARARIDEINRRQIEADIARQEKENQDRIDRMNKG